MCLTVRIYLGCFNYFLMCHKDFDWLVHSGHRQTVPKCVTWFACWTITEWLSRIILYSLSVSRNSVQRSKHFVSMRSARPKDLSLFWSSICPRHLTLGPSTLRFTSELLRQSSNLNLPVLRGQQFPNTVSLHKSIVRGLSFELFNTGDLNFAAYCWPSIDSRTSNRGHRCLKVVTANREFCMRKCTCSDIPPPGKMHPPRLLNPSNSPCKN